MAALRIEYTKAGTIPPVFVAGSFTAWQPVEMQGSDGHFSHEFQDVADGEHQYKFKLGTEGDWWTTDDQVKSVRDEHGNKNNVITVGSLPKPQDATTNATKDTAHAQAVSETAKNQSTLDPSPPQSATAIPEAAAKPETMPKQVVDTTAGVAETTPKPDHPKETSVAPITESVAKPATPVKQVASTAAEVADTASRLDKPKEAATAPTPESAVRAPTPAKQVASTAAEVADTASKLDQFKEHAAVAPTTQKDVEKDKTAEPIAPAVIPNPKPAAPVPAASVAPSPPLSPQLPPTPASPMKSLDSALLPDTTLKPSQQEVAVATPVPSTPTQRKPSMKPAQDDDKVLVSPARVALPASPEPTHTGEFPEDNEFKLVKRQTTFRERSVAVAATVMAVPNMILAFFTSLMAAFTDWLDAVFNPQRRAKEE